MAYQVHWQLVGRSGQPLDHGRLGEGLCAFGDAVATVVEFLRQYQEVDHCPTESYWLARRSIDADLAVWVWIERHETNEATRTVSDGSLQMLQKSNRRLRAGRPMHGGWILRRPGVTN